MRGATTVASTRSWGRQYFNPRSSCEERLESDCGLGRDVVISIHAPHARSDATTCMTSHFAQISIHAPHARSDLTELQQQSSSAEFQSTLLMREATVTPGWSWIDPQFQSTLLMRGATRIMILDITAETDFNPRSSCEERRPWRGSSPSAQGNFNPRSSCEERLLSCALRMGTSHFNPRSSCEERPGPACP